MAGVIPKIVLGTHLNLPVQGKVSIRHLRVMLIHSFLFSLFPIMSQTNKVILRKEMRERRRSLADHERCAAAKGLLANLASIGVLDAARCIALYLVNDGEIDPIEVMHWCWANQRLVYVPIVVQEKKNTLVFAPVSGNTEFRENRYGIPEPVVDTDQVIGPEDLDLVLLPLVAFDSMGNRLGMGGGFYDTTFEFVRGATGGVPTLVGIAHELQRVERIDSESWDIPLATVVTDQGIYRSPD